MKLDQLKQIAEAATPGAWDILQEAKYSTPSAITCKNKRAWDEDDDEYGEICLFPRTSEYRRGSDVHIGSDAVHIATFNPQTCLELLERVRVLSEALDSLKSEATYIVNECDSHRECGICGPYKKVITALITHGYDVPLKGSE